MNYWQDYWEKHARETQHADPQVQVMRTWEKQPMSAATFQSLLQHLFELLELHEENRCLDLCCGNGLIATALAARVAEVVAVDFVADLLEQIDLQQFPNVVLQCQDMRRCDYPPHSFDRVLLHAGLQYLSLGEAAALVRRIRGWLRPGGRLVLGDIPDAERMWHFFDTPARRADYFRHLERDEPIIGTWFSPVWVGWLAAEAGFHTYANVAQPAWSPYRHFRFDFVASVE